jgi:hypothetical protein
LNSLGPLASPSVLQASTCFDGQEQFRKQYDSGPASPPIQLGLATPASVSEVPRCWHLHPGLVDELIALRHYHEEVTSPLVPLVQPDPVADLPEAEDPATPARAYQDWHEARWRWTNGPLREEPQVA